MSLKKYVGSFEVNLSGEYIPREMSSKIIEPSKVVIVIDEFSKRIYLWLGAKSSQNSRMGARRAVKTIPTFGLRAKGLDFPVGKECKIIEIDESIEQSDSSTHSNLAELRKILGKTYTKVTDGIWYAKETTPQEREEKPEAKIVERRLLFEMSHLEKESIEKDKKKKVDEHKQ
jgi:hypothetical protein